MSQDLASSIGAQLCRECSAVIPRGGLYCRPCHVRLSECPTHHVAALLILRDTIGGALYRCPIAGIDWSAA